MSNQIINIVPVFTARRIAGELLRRQGFEFFTLTEKDGLSFRLDPEKLEMVMELARRDAQILAPQVPASARDLRFCKRQLRREMIRHATSGLGLS